MKLTVTSLYAMRPPGKPDPLKEAYDNGLPIWASIAINQLMNEITKQMKLVDPERMRIVKEYGKPQKDNPDMYDMPGVGTKKFKEVNDKFSELGNQIVKIEYEPIDLNKLAKDMDGKDNNIIKGDFITIITDLNKIYEDEQKESQEEKVEKPESDTAH